MTCIPSWARLHEHVHQVVGVLAEERVRVDDVVEAAPVAPLPRERPQREGLPRAGVAVPEHELPAVRRPEAAASAGRVRARRGCVVRSRSRSTPERRSSRHDGIGPCGEYVQNVTVTSCAELGRAAGTPRAAARACVDRLHRRSRDGRVDAAAAQADGREDAVLVEDAVRSVRSEAQEHGLADTRQARLRSSSSARFASPGSPLSSRRVHEERLRRVLGAVDVVCRAGRCGFSGRRPSSASARPDRPRTPRATPDGSPARRRRCRRRSLAHLLLERRRARSRPAG